MKPRSILAQILLFGGKMRTTPTRLILDRVFSYGVLYGVVVLKKLLTILSITFGLLFAPVVSVRAVTETFTPSHDSFLNSVYPSNTYGGAGSLICGWIPAGAIRYPVLKFDLSDIPVNAEIEKVHLQLYTHEASGLDNVPIEVFFLNEDWHENTVNWDNAPPATGLALGRLDVNKNFELREWELDAGRIKLSWIETPEDNFGLILKGDYDGAESFARTFRSDETSVLSERPQLSITYSLPDETPPDLSEVTASEIASEAAAITWQTNEEATSWVEYWKMEGFVTTAGQDEWATNHRVTLWDLDPETAYTFRVISEDAEGNEAASDEHEFTTLAAPEGGEEPEVTTPEPTTPTEPEESEVLGTETPPGEVAGEAVVIGGFRLSTITFGLGALVVVLAFVILFLLKQKESPTEKGP